MNKESNLVQVPSENALIVAARSDFRSQVSSLIAWFKDLCKEMAGNSLQKYAIIFPDNQRIYFSPNSSIVKVEFDVVRQEKTDRLQLYLRNGSLSVNDENKTCSVAPTKLITTFETMFKDFMKTV